MSSCARTDGLSGSGRSGKLDRYKEHDIEVVVARSSQTRNPRRARAGRGPAGPPRPGPRAWARAPAFSPVRRRHPLLVFDDANRRRDRRIVSGARPKAFLVQLAPAGGVRPAAATGGSFPGCSNRRTTRRRPSRPGSAPMGSTRLRRLGGRPPLPGMRRSAAEPGIPGCEAFVSRARRQGGIDNAAADEEKLLLREIAGQPLAQAAAVFLAAGLAMLLLEVDDQKRRVRSRVRAEDRGKTGPLAHRQADVGDQRGNLLLRNHLLDGLFHAGRRSSRSPPAACPAASSCGSPGSPRRPWETARCRCRTRTRAKPQRPPPSCQ